MSAPVAKWAFVAVVAGVPLVRFAPQYSISGSYAYTVAAFYLFQWFSYGLYWVILYPRFISPLRDLPEPKGNTPFMGQFYAIFNEPGGQPLRRWINEIPNEGLIRYRHLFNVERLLITSPRALGEVLVAKNYEFIKPPQMRAGLSRLLGVGILLAEGDEHKIQRKNLMPAFAFRHIKDLYPGFWAKTAELNQALESELSKDPTQTIEIGGWLSRATLDIIGIAGMGQDFGSIRDPSNELCQTYQEIFAPFPGQKVLILISLILPEWVLRNLRIKRNEDVVSAAGTIKRVCREMIQQKRLGMEKKEQAGIDILSVALQSGQFTDEQLVNQMMTFLAAGHETTATAGQWAIYALAQNQQIQDRLRAEIRDQLPSISDPTTTITAAMLDEQLPYLHACCNEVLRFHSPVPLTMRESARDTSIQGHAVPAGTRIILSPWAVNFSEELWGPDANQFNPERWIGLGKANTGGAQSNYAFLTFLHGPRSCIGQGFAKAEFAILLAGLVGRFRFELANPDEEIDIKGGITSKPKDGVNVKMSVVEGW